MCECVCVCIDIDKLKHDWIIAAYESKKINLDFCRHFYAVAVYIKVRVLQ